MTFVQRRGQFTIPSHAVLLEFEAGGALSDNVLFDRQSCLGECGDPTFGQRGVLDSHLRMMGDLKIEIESRSLINL